MFALFVYMFVTIVLFVLIGPLAVPFFSNYRVRHLSDTEDNILSQSITQSLSVNCSASRYTYNSVIMGFGAPGGGAAPMKPTP